MAIHEFPPDPYERGSTEGSGEGGFRPLIPEGYFDPSKLRPVFMEHRFVCEDCSDTAFVMLEQASGVSGGGWAPCRRCMRGRRIRNGWWDQTKTKYTRSNETPNELFDPWKPEVP